MRNRLIFFHEWKQIDGQNFSKNHESKLSFRQFWLLEHKDRTVICLINPNFALLLLRVYIESILKRIREESKMGEEIGLPILVRTLILSLTLLSLSILGSSSSSLQDVRIVSAGRRVSSRSILVSIDINAAIWRWTLQCFLGFSLLCNRTRFDPNCVWKITHLGILSCVLID